VRGSDIERLESKEPSPSDKRSPKR
jgi:hypothetical protein